MDVSENLSNRANRLTVPETNGFRIHLINPANVRSGFAVMTPRWMPVLAAATPSPWINRLRLCDMAVDQLDYGTIKDQDLVGLSLHTLNAARGYEIIRSIKACSKATVAVGGVHVTVCPDEALEFGADAVVTGDGERIWPDVVNDFAAGRMKQCYDGGRIASDLFISAPRWDLTNHRRYMMATVQTTRGCPEKCTFCSVWRTDGRTVRFRTLDDTIGEINNLHRFGFRMIVLADDNFFAVGAGNESQRELILKDRMELMRRLEFETPSDLTFLTQTTIRTAEDETFMNAMRRARIRGVLIGVESIDSKTLASLNKTFNKSGLDLVDAVDRIQRHGIYVLGSYIVGLAQDDANTPARMLEIAQKSNMALAQFVQYTFFPGTVDHNMLARGKHALTLVPGFERFWLVKARERKFLIHPTLTERQIRAAMSYLWDGFYSTNAVIRRGLRLGLRSARHLFAYLVFCKFYKRVYAGYGMSADSARTVEVGWFTRWLGQHTVQSLKGPLNAPASSNVSAPLSHELPPGLTTRDGRAKHNSSALS